MLGTVAALASEARCLGRTPRRHASPCRAHAAVAVCIAGMGQANAAACARELVAHGAGALVSWGFAGALDNALQPGTLILPEQIMDARGNCQTVDPAWRQRLHDVLVTDATLNIRGGTLLSLTAVVSGTTARQRLRRDSAAVAVDMESAAVARIAQRGNLPFVAIRSITDNASNDLPSTAFALIDGAGRLHPLRGLLHWARHPQQTLPMLRVVRNTRRAQRSLCNVVHRVGPRLQAPLHVPDEPPLPVSCRH